MGCLGRSHIRLRNKFACDVANLCARAVHEVVGREEGARADKNAYGTTTPPSMADRVSPARRRRQAVAQRR